MTTRTTEYRYNVDGLLEELVCHNVEEGEQVTRWEYGTELNEDGSGIARADLVRAKVYPDGGRVEYGYNRLAEVTRMEDPNGTVHEYAYDALNRLIADRVTEVGAGIDGAVRAIRISYVARGEVERVTSYDDPDATVPEHVVNDVLYTYNWYGQVTEEFQSHDGPADTLSWGVAYGYDTGSGNKSRLAGLRYPNNHLVLYRFLSAVDDGFNKVSNIGPVDGAPDVNYQRLGLDVTVETSYLSGLQMTALRQGLEGVGDGGDIYAGLDRFGRLQEARWVDLTPVPPLDVERVVFGFDRVGNRKWRRNLLSGAEPWDEIYRYDGLYQVTGLERGKLNVNRTGVNGVPAWQEQWRYDAMGNWLRYDTAGNGTPALEQARAYNAANELLFINGSNALLGFDAVGNMTRAPQPTDWEEGFDLKWDAWNRLVEISEMGTEVVVARYGYDGLARRITKETEIATTPVLRHFYYSNRWQVVEERLNGSTDADRQFLWGIKHVDDLVYRQRFDGEGEPTERLWALNDGKNVTAIALDHEVVERYAYDAFGTPEVLKPDFTAKTSSEPDYSWETMFCGYRWDKESELYQVRYRYYHSQLGRWLSRDPLRQSVVNRNLFLYVGNQAFRRRDALGLFESPEFDNVDQAGVFGALLAYYATLSESVVPIEGTVFPQFREYCGLICCKKNGDFIITEPVPGKFFTQLVGKSVEVLQNCEPFRDRTGRPRSCPEGSTLAGTYHSHGPGSANPSPTDYHTSLVNRGIPGYIGCGRIQVTRYRGTHRGQLGKAMGNAGSILIPPF